MAKGPDLKKTNGKGSVSVCKHYDMKGHTIKMCYKIIAFPKDYKLKTEFSSRNKPIVNNVNSDQIVSSG